MTARLASMNASFVSHSSSTLKNDRLVTRQGVDSTDICRAVGMLCWIVSHQPTDLVNNLSASDLKALMALSNCLRSEHKLRCMLLFDYKREDMYNLALKQIKAVLLSSDRDDLLRLTLELTKHMQKGCTSMQKVQLNRVEVMLQARGAELCTQIQEQLAPAVLRLPFILTTQGSTLKANMDGTYTQFSFLDRVHEDLLVDETGCVELRELLRSVVRKIAEQAEGEITTAGAAGKQLSITHLSETIAGRLLGSPMEGCELMLRVITGCEESWLDASAPAAASVTPPPTWHAAVQVTLHLGLITNILEKQIGVGGSPLTERSMWEKVLQYVSFAFSKLVVCSAQEEGKRYFSFLNNLEEPTNKTENENEENSSVLQVFQACKDVIPRLQEIFQSGTNMACVVSCCVAKILQSQPFLQEYTRSVNAPRAVIDNSVWAVCGDAAFCPLSSLLGGGYSALLRTDTLCPQLVLAMSLSDALHKDLVSLSTMGTVRVGLSSFPASLGVVDALRPWAEADARASMSLVVDAVSHRLAQVAKRNESLERDAMEDGRDDRGGDERPLLLSIIRLTRCVRDVALLFKVPNVELLDMFTAARLNSHGNYQYNAQGQSEAVRGVEGTGGINLTERVAHNPFCVLHAAAFLTCLCESGEEANITEQLQQSLVSLFAKEPTSALLLINDITFLGPILSVYSDAVVSERISSCINLLLRAKSTGTQDNSYVIELLKTYLATLPNFLTATRNGATWPEIAEGSASRGLRTSLSAPDFAEIERLEREILDKFCDQSQSSAITDFLRVGGPSSTTKSSVASVFVRVHALNRLATLSGANKLAARAARAYLYPKSELFDALMSGGSAQQDRCRLIFSPLEQELCQSPSTSESKYLGLVSSAKLEFLLSHHCAGQTDVGEGSLPWANWNGLTFSFLHALRSTVRVMGDNNSRTFVADAQCVALLDAYSSFVSLPVLATVLQWLLLALLKPSSSEESSAASNREETDRVVLQKYACAALALLESPQIPLEQTAQALCGAFSDLVIMKLWRWFVGDTEPFRSTFLPILDRAVALMVCKTRDEDGVKAPTICAPLLFLSATVARQLVEAAGPPSPATELCRRLHANCSLLLRPVKSAPREHQYAAPLSLVSQNSGVSEYFASVESTLFIITHQIAVKESSAEVSVVVRREPDTICDAAVPGMVSFSSLMSFILGLRTISEGAARTQSSSRSATVDDGHTVSLTDAEFDGQVSGAVWAPALRGSSDAWAPADFTLVQLLEKLFEEEFRGDNGQFVAAALKVLLSYDRCWLSASSSTEMVSTWSSRRARVLVVLLQFVRNKSTRAAAVMSVRESSVLSLAAASFQASTELASAVVYARDKDVSRHLRNVLLRRALRWKLSLLRFVDVHFVANTLQLDILREEEAVRELGNVVALCRWCAKWKEPVPTHARNVFIIVLGSIVTALLSLQVDGQLMQGQVKEGVGAVLSHLLQNFPPGPCGFLVHCQGILLKYSVRRSVVVCSVLKEVIDSDEQLAALHAQVTAYGMAAHQHSTSTAPAANTATNTPSMKRPATAMSPRGSATSSAQNCALHAASDVANKKPRKSRPFGDSATDGVVATPQSQQGEDRPRADIKTEPHHIPSSFHTPHTLDTDADSGEVQLGSGTHAHHAPPSTLRANNSFLSAIMEVPTVASPEASTPQTELPSVPQTPAPTTAVQHSTIANFEFAPGSAAKSAKSTPSTTEPSGRPAVVAHVSKKFGGGF